MPARGPVSVHAAPRGTHAAVTLGWAARVALSPVICVQVTVGRQVLRKGVRTALENDCTVTTPACRASEATEQRRERTRDDGSHTASWLRSSNERVTHRLTHRLTRSPAGGVLRRSPPVGGDAKQSPLPRGGAGGPAVCLHLLCRCEVSARLWSMVPPPACSLLFLFFQNPSTPAFRLDIR